MQWHPYIYKDDFIKERFDKIKNNIEHGGMGGIGLYIITMSSCPAMQLDIIASHYLKQPYYRDHLPMIVGIAKGYFSAVDLIQQMLEDTIANNYPGELKRLFSINA